MARQWAALAVCLLLIWAADAAKQNNRKGKNKAQKAPVVAGERDVLAELDSLKSVIAILTRQLSQQQQFVEERIRSEGSSGVKQLRESSKAYSDPFYGHTYSGSRFASMHDHANNIRTVGMGEMSAVLNGVEFRTRHNDYRLNMASTKPKGSESDYHAIEPIPFPDVPAEVTNKKTVSEQMEEMKLWFKAWKDQDFSVRDYRQYFKPVLCYMEGAWTNSKSKIDEPFASDRHFVDADSWFDLQEKIRFTSYTGRKSDKENYAFLPTTIVGMNNESIPQLAQWNYRILCHPLKQDVPLKMLKIVDDLASRKSQGKSLDKFQSSRAARFRLSTKNGVTYRNGQVSPPSFLDQLMMEIPGKDNYRGDIVDDALDSLVVDVNTRFSPNKTAPHLNAAFYHRFYKTTGRDAMGLAIRRRGYSDPNLFVALNTQERVASMKVNTKKRVKIGNRIRRVKVEYEQRVSYAIPLEIIYMTPLSKWNPYDIEHKGTTRSKLGLTVTQGGRNGGKSIMTAYNGTNEKAHYITPIEFFQGNKKVKDSADTTKGSVGVLDKAGVLRYTAASGTRVFLPSVGDLGLLRTRWPIAPVHADGNMVYKEVTALKELVINGRQNAKYYEHPISGFPDGNSENYEDEVFTYQMMVSTKATPGPHIHEFEMTGHDINAMKNGTTVTVTTTEVSGHSHELELMYNKGRDVVMWKTCDGRKFKCWDGHERRLSCLDCSAK